MRVFANLMLVSPPQRTVGVGMLARRGAPGAKSSDAVGPPCPRDRPLDEQQQNACCKRKQERVEPAHIYRPVTTLNMPIANPSTIAVAMTIPALFPMMSISPAPSALRAVSASWSLPYQGEASESIGFHRPTPHPTPRTRSSPAPNALHEAPP